MNAVGRIGSYISRGVYTVSGPFHPFGGAVDIIVVEQPDGGFKSSPWYVRFGKFQGVLKTKEKVVNISVNGIEANFNMYLDHKGEAYFLKEVDAEEGESVLYISTSGDETDGQSTSNRRPMKSKCCNYDADKLNPADQIGASNSEIVALSGSRRARIFGLVFGQRSTKEDSCQEGEGDVRMARLNSLERAEIAADLLEVKWSTNMLSSKFRKDNISHYILDDNVAKNMRINDGEMDVKSSEHDDEPNRNDHSLFHEETSSLNEQMASSSSFSSENLGSSVEDAGVRVSCIGTVEQVVESSILGESIFKEHSEMASEISRRIDEFGVESADDEEHAIFHEETDSLNEQIAYSSNLSSENLGSSVEDVGVRISCTGMVEQVNESPALDESILEEHSEMASKISRRIDEVGVGNADHDEHALFDKARASLGEQMGSSSNFSSENLQGLVEDPGVTISCMASVEQIIESSTLEESILKKNSEIVSEVSRRINESNVGNDDKQFDEEQACADSRIQCEFEADHSKQFDEDQACDKKVDAFPGSRTSTETRSDGGQSFVYCGTSDSSVVRLDGSNEQTQETLHVAGGGCGKVHVHLETLQLTTEILQKGTHIKQAKDIGLEKEPLDVSGDHSDKMNPATREPNFYGINFEEPSKAGGSYDRVVSIEPGLCLVKEIYSQNSCKSLNDVQVGKDISEELHHYLKFSDDSQEPYCDCVPVRNSPSEIPEEEQFLFSDLDEAKFSEVQHTDLSSSDCAKKGDHPTFCAEGIMEVNGSVSSTDESFSSPDMLGLDNQLNDLENSTKRLRVMSSPINIHGSQKTAEEVGRLAESLPIIQSPTAKLGAHDYNPLSHSLDSNSDSLKWKLFKENDSSCLKLVANKEQHMTEERPNVKDSRISQVSKSVPSSPPVGGSWMLWPFTFRRSRSRNGTQPPQSDTKSSDAEVASERSNDGDVAKSVCKPKVMKKMIRVITPTFEQLASLNLKEGSNTITFTFFTAMLGKQQVDARIYLWKWNTRIVISDVDGTITKSDVLGQFMPLVGMDWSQMGVAHLFSAIKENGYQLLFLSARAISQAYHTRQFLFNLKQDGKALPEGPVVISPDGLFPSLYREVIRRAPHEFKISCLEDIKALFPSDCNPFYAGFGNRDTDEISYLKVGIPRGKIFIINPKGQVAVNRRLDTKSYSSLHALVHDMFPHTTSSEQEDFNSWNFWKLPPPDVDV